MKLILNGVNGAYLREVRDNAGGKVERVDAAVAYATTDQLLFDWCWQEKIPLRFWGRFDEAIPVAVPVLERFLQRASARYSCKLVRHFHPKVIWWRGYGAYIGSGNLTNAAWYNNIEAGVFLTEEELERSGQAIELEALFARVDREASPLTEELLILMRRRELELRRRREAQKDADDAFLATDLVRDWPGLVQATSASASSQQREEFLQEWLSTLQIIRDISRVVSREENRPPWVSPEAPLGAQADQFLHAHYYRRTFVGQKADYETHYQANWKDPDRALTEAVAWWRGLPGGSGEERTLNEIAPTLRANLSREALASMDEAGFVATLSGIHASVEYARRVPNAMVGLADDAAYTIPEKVDALGKRIWRDSTERGTPVTETLDFVLYGGVAEEVPHRLWEALRDPRRKVEMLGVSSLGEIVGWAMPDRYPPRNGRTSKALRSLGHDVRVHVGG